MSNQPLLSQPDALTNSGGLRPRPAAHAAPARRAQRLTTGPFEWLQVALILIYVWRIQDLFPILSAIQFPILASLAALAIFFLGGKAQRSLPRYRQRLVRISTFILIWMFLSVPGGVYPGLSLKFLINDHLKTYLMMLTLIASIRGFEDLNRLVLANVLGAAIYCAEILTVFQVGTSGRLGNLFYYDANDLAMLVVCTLPFVVFSLRPSATSKLRLAALGIAAIFVLTIVKAGSRGGFLGLIAVSLYLLLGFRAVAARIRFGAVALCAILLFSIAGPQFWNMMGTMLHPKDDYNFNGDQAGRQAVWERGIGYMKGNPVFGVGANAFPQAEGMISELVAQQNMGRGIKWSAAHNAFVQIGAELGVPGLIALIAQLVTIVATCIAIGSKRSRASPDERALAQAMVGTVVGYVVCGFFLSQAYSAFLYATCALTVGLASIVGQTSETPTERGGRVRAAVRRRPRWSGGAVALPPGAVTPGTPRLLPRSRSRWQQ